MCVYLVNLTVWVNGIACTFSFFVLADDATEACIVE
jgi:hypothetical protein